MPRHKKKRKIQTPPKMQGFKPFGIRLCETDKVIVNFEEYESIKLVVHDKLSQEEAAAKLEVSRPTLTRIYNSALQKIGEAFVEGKSILIQGGNYEFEKDWYKCNRCHKIIDSGSKPKKCNECNKNNPQPVTNLNTEEKY